jgi:DNA gyrase subunit B
MREGLCVRVREGARAEVQLADEGQAGVVEVRAPVEDVVAKALEEFLQETPNDAKIICEQDRRCRARS